jgi:hypothetical protein
VWQKSAAIGGVLFRKVPTKLKTGFHFQDLAFVTRPQGLSPYQNLIGQQIYND